MRRVRQLSYWSFLAFFAVVSVGGRGLHLLPGFAHSCAPGATACAHRHDHALAGYRHHAADKRHTAHTSCAHGHAGGTHQAQTPAPAEAPGEPHSDDGCLLCQFCSQAQQQSYSIDLLPTGSCFAAPPAVVVQPSTTFERIYQSRAPPAIRSAA